MAETLAADPATDAATHRAARRVIQEHALLAAGATLIPFTLIDNLSVTAVQLTMLQKLARVYRCPPQEKELAAVLGSAGGGVLSFFIARSQPALALKAGVLAIPGIGPLLRYGTGPAIMAAYTWVLGEAFRRHFAAGGNAGDFKMDHLKDVVWEVVPGLPPRN